MIPSHNDTTRSAVHREYRILYVLLFTSCACNDFRAAAPFSSSSFLVYNKGTPYYNVRFLRDHELEKATGGGPQNATRCNMTNVYSSAASPAHGRKRLHQAKAKAHARCILNPSRYVRYVCGGTHTHTNICVCARVPRARSDGSNL